MDFVTIYTVWLTIFSVSFTFLPLFMVLEWRKRGTADGFSSVNLVIPALMMACWLRYGFLTNDNGNIIVNGVNLFFFVFYIAAFAFYQPKRKYLLYQLAVGGIALLGIFNYVAGRETHEAAETMGAIAASVQIVGLAGAIYELYRVVRFKHTEYVPANMTFGITAMASQWLLFGLLIHDFYITIANVAGLLVNLMMVAMYVVYPPLTWRVPLLGTGPQQKKTD